MTGEREYLGDAKIYGVPHRVFVSHVSVPEHEVDPWTDEETGETFPGYTAPPTERIEVEFSSLALSHAGGYTAEMLFPERTIRRAVDAINAAGEIEGHQVEARLLGLDDA